MPLRTFCIMIIAIVFIGTLLNADLSHATTYYVATTGSNSNTCAQAQSTATPKATLSSAVSCMSAGDTLQIRGGSYTESLNCQVVSCPTGSAGKPITIMEFPGETVAINGNFNFFDTNKQYWVIGGGTTDRTKFTMTHALFNMNESVNGRAVDFFTLKNMKLDGSAFTGSTCLICVEGTNNLFQNLEVFNFGGTANDHGFYLTGNATSAASNNIIESSIIHDISGYGVHIYVGDGAKSASNNIVRNNRVYQISKYVGQGATGILLGNGSGNKAYNNIVYNINGAWLIAAIEVGYSCSNCVVFNNTITHNVSGYCIQVDSSASNTQVKNNICYDLRGYIRDNGTGTVASNNLISGANPQLVSSSDFHLQSGSPAIDAGATLGAPYDVDSDGISRPQGAAYDIGAFEYTAASPLPGPTILTVSP